MPDLAENSASTHEQLCNNCGKCCYKKIIVGRTVFITPFPCEFLDTSTNLCTIYDKREELNPLCLTVEEGMKVSAFPEDCPYVPAMAPKNYKPARDDWDWKHEWDGFDELADDLDVKAETREKVRARGPYLPPMHVEAYAKIQARREADAQMIWGSQAQQIVDLRRPNAAAAIGPVEQTVPSLAAMAQERSDNAKQAKVDRVVEMLATGEAKKGAGG